VAVNSIASLDGNQSKCLQNMTLQALTSKNNDPLSKHYTSTFLCEQTFAKKHCGIAKFKNKLLMNE